MAVLRKLVVALAGVAAACGRPPVPPTAEQIETVLAADAMFGSAAALERRLFADDRFVAAVDLAARAQFVEAWRSRLDAAAAARVLAALDGADVAAAVTFFTSDAGRAFASARDTALALADHAGGHDFPRTTATLYGDPAQVGKERVRSILAEVQEQMAAGGSNRSPVLLALEIAAARVEPEQARAIAGFFATATGRRWLDGEARVNEDMEATWREFTMAARTAGVVRERVPGFGKLPPYVPRQGR